MTKLILAVLSFIMIATIASNAAQIDVGISPDMTEYGECVITYYTSDPRENGKWGPVDAEGNPLEVGICANNHFKLGTKVYIEGIGELTVKDRMPKRYGKRNFDVYVDMTHDEALKLPQGEKRKVYMINDDV